MFPGGRVPPLRPLCRGMRVQHCCRGCPGARCPWRAHLRWHDYACALCFGPTTKASGATALNCMNSCTAGGCWGPRDQSVPHPCQAHSVGDLGAHLRLCYVRAKSLWLHPACSRCRDTQPAGSHGVLSYLLIQRAQSCDGRLSGDSSLQEWVMLLPCMCSLPLTQPGCLVNQGPWGWGAHVESGSPLCLGLDICKVCM